MSNGDKDARISARVRLSDKEKLKKSGFNPREAIEYFNHISMNTVDGLKIEEFFLNKEIEELKEDLIIKERRLGKIQKRIEDIHIDRLSSMRVDSYKKMIDVYNNMHSNNESFEDFIDGSYVQDNYVALEVHKFPDCSRESYCDGLIEYYNDVILVGKTF